MATVSSHTLDRESLPKAEEGANIARVQRDLGQHELLSKRLWRTSHSVIEIGKIARDGFCVVHLLQRYPAKPEASIVSLVIKESLPEVSFQKSSMNCTPFLPLRQTPPMGRA